MTHDFSICFRTEDPMWSEVLKIIEKNKNKPKKKSLYRQLHHIWPRSFSKIIGEQVDNSDDNIISLSEGEHFLIHYYYWKLAKPKFIRSCHFTVKLMWKNKMYSASTDTMKKIAEDYDEFLAK